MKIDACRSCGADVVWLKARTGSNMIVDADTVCDGDVFYDHSRHRSHWATCPNAAQHRKPKAEHVLAAGQTREHKCHWPTCSKQVPPAMWGCRRHWFMLPAPIRNAIWRAYVPGQENTMTPSAAYLEAAEAAQRWIRETGKQ